MSTNLEVMRKISTNTSVEQTFALALNNPAKRDLAMMNLSHVVTNMYNIEKLDQVSVANAVVAMTNLGFAATTGEGYVIPYGDKATFQIGYKGWIQLALRSGKIAKLNAAPIFKGEYLGFDRVKDEHKFNLKQEAQSDDNIIGYVGYLKTVQGFEKTIYWTAEEMHKHFVKFSLNNYDEVKRVWMDSKKYNRVSKILDVKKKAQITILKQLISKWAPKDATLEMALANDGKTYDENGQGTFDPDKTEHKTLPKRVAAPKADIQLVLGDLGKALVAKNPELTSKTVWPEMNTLGKKAGIDFNVSSGWFGVTKDELKALAIVVKAELGVELSLDGVVLSQDKPEAQKETEYDL